MGGSCRGAVAVAVCWAFWVILSFLVLGRSRLLFELLFAFACCSYGHERVGAPYGGQEESGAGEEADVPAAL